jgi:predicted metal-dependent hydrolase
VVGGRAIEYRLERSARRRSVVIHVDERGLRVGAPWAVGEPAIERLLDTHAAWIERRLRVWALRRPPEPDFGPQGYCYLRGERVALGFDPDSAGRCDAQAGVARIEAGRLVLAVAPGSPAAEVRDALARFLRATALADFEAWARTLAPRAGVPVPAVGLSRARSRWGSCSARGRILVNWRLVQAPPALAEYVVAHEVAHLLHMNHSAAFWRAVAALVPDCAARRAVLRSEAHRYLLL